MKEFKIIKVRQRHCIKVNDIKKLKFNIIKLSKWHLKTKKYHYSVWISDKSYNGLDCHIWIWETSYVRWKPHLHPKPKDIRYIDHLTYMLFNIKSRSFTHTWHINISLNIYSYIKCETLTRIWHINISPLSVRLYVPVIDHRNKWEWYHSPKISENDTTPTPPKCWNRI